MKISRGFGYRQPMLQKKSTVASDTLTQVVWRGPSQLEEQHTLPVARTSLTVASRLVPERASDC